MSGRLLRRLALYAAAIFACVIAIFPVYRIVSMSFMPSLEAFSVPPQWTFEPELTSYRQLFEGFMGIDVRRHLVNSLVIAAGSTALPLAIGLLGAYATARFTFRGRNVAVGIVLITRMLPPIAMIVPMFLYVYQFGMLDTRSSLIWIYTALNLPFAFWMLHGFIKTVPPEMIDAALVDGCTPLSALWRIVVPVIAPGMAAAAAFCFIFSWNDFALAAVLATDDAKTMPMMIFYFRGPEGAAWGPMAAAATLAITPPVVLMLFLQKWMVRGLTMGSTKG